MAGKFCLLLGTLSLKRENSRSRKKLGEILGCSRVYFRSCKWILAQTKIVLELSLLSTSFFAQATRFSLKLKKPSNLKFNSETLFYNCLLF